MGIEEEEEKNAVLKQASTFLPTWPTWDTQCQPSAGWHPTNLLRSSPWQLWQWQRLLRWRRRRCVYCSAHPATIRGGTSTCRQSSCRRQQQLHTSLYIFHFYRKISPPCFIYWSDKYTCEIYWRISLTNMIVLRSGLACFLARPGWGVGGFCWQVFPARPS